MSNSYIQDLGATYAAAAASKQPVHSTSRKPDNNSLDMNDFLQLMVVQLQNQTMDNTTDTSDMLNQLVQMQMVTAMVNMTDASIVTYASSLVGKTVTVGVYNGKNFEEKVIEVMGTGQVNGEQVIFSTDGDAYKLSDIMAVGRLPEIKDPEKPGEGDGEDGDVEKPGEGDGDVEKPGEGGGDVEKPGEGDGAEGPGDVEEPGEGGGIENPGENPSEPEDDGPRGEVDPEKDPEAYQSAVGK